MNENKLNLGPFNDCIDIRMFDGLSIPVTSRTIKYRVSEDMITVPIITLGLAADRDTPKTRKELKQAIELKVLNMIYRAVDKVDGLFELQLNKVRIPIVSVNFSIDHSERLCITARLGVVVFNNGSVGPLEASN